MIGLAAAPREPSLVWQAAQTAVAMAAPLAGTGALDAGWAAAGAPDCAATPDTAKVSGQRAERSCEGLHE